MGCDGALLARRLPAQFPLSKKRRRQNENEQKRKRISHDECTTKNRARLAQCPRGFADSLAAMILSLGGSRLTPGSRLWTFARRLFLVFLLRLRAQVGLNEHIDLAVEHGLDLAGLRFCAHILDQRVGL